jgi:sphingolipid 8-(E)-desaturase
MLTYKIGRFEGRWRNFLPPVQGGKFRSRQELDTTELAASDDSSEDISPAPSPIFDPVDASSTFRRRRRRTSDGDSSQTSVSSGDLEDKPKMSHLDLRTREEIRLDLDKYPSLDPEVQDDIVRKYRLLYRRIEAEGLFQCPYSSYLVETIRYSLIFLTSQYFLRKAWTLTGWSATGCYFTSAVFLGLFWHQLVFSAHDAGHLGITHNYHVDSVLGIFIADFLGGLSLGWWKRNHNVHHIVTNSPEHDPDIQHMPFFAVSHRFLQSLRSTYYERVMAFDAVSRFVIGAQAYLYYPLLGFGRFNLYRLSWEYLLTGQAPSKGPAWWHRWLEIVGQVFFWSWFGYGIVYRSIPSAFDRIIFLLISHIVTMPVHVQITLSHFAMSTSDLGVNESFPQKMLRTTMDVDCPQWLDFVHGGLQFQAVHHLYPRIPRHNLRRTQKLVQEFCDDVNIPYAVYGFVDGNKQVLGRLEEVSRQAAILAECQRTMAASKDFGLH